MLNSFKATLEQQDLSESSITSYLAKKLGQSFSVMPVFSNTPHSYVQRENIRDYLGYGEFNELESIKLEEWLVSQLRKETLDKEDSLSLPQIT
ncbi:hypothetical protein ACD661_16380 [Legionella lytica]|uniref:Uncharacterized protein n=1 Tax=Legionella lytica TaxID=96232 RepID=A0ABW8DDS1_9GAMM